jgi:glycosyltransferase involved in cell wall biosynthesis
VSGIEVLAFGAWDRGAGYPRGTALLDSLRRRGVAVTECRVDLPYQGADKRRLLASPWRWPRYWLSMRRARRQALRVLRQTLASASPDLVLVPYPGHLVVGWVRAVWTGPLVLDLFLSAHDTIIVDRQLFGAGSMMARLMRRLDRRAAAAADRVLLDTEQNADHVARLVGLSRRRFVAVPVSDPGESASPPPYRPPGVGDKLEVLFFGTGVPLHGLGYLLDALEHCEGVRLTLVGGAPADRARARFLAPPKIRILGEFLPDDELRRRLARTHLVAGVFGTSQKTDRVVPLKVMLALGAGRPVITARTTAIASVLQSGRECITVPAGDSRALAAALQRLADAPAPLAELARAARQAYEREFALSRVGGRLLEVFAGLGVGVGAAPPAVAPPPAPPPAAPLRTMAPLEAR